MSLFSPIRIRSRSDIFGSLASGLCLIHCLATPLLFAAHTGHIHGHHSSPEWWGLIDILFIEISLFAVYWSAKNTSRQWMRIALWISWALLAFVIINEKFGFMHLSEWVIYFPSLSLVGLHLYNRKYCRCAEETCCVQDQS